MKIKSRIQQVALSSKLTLAGYHQRQKEQHLVIISNLTHDYLHMYKIQNSKVHKIFLIHKLNTNTIVTAIYYFHKNTLNLGNCEFGFGLKRKPLPIHSLRLTLGIKSCGIILRNVFIGCCGVLTFGGKEKLSISRTWSVWLYHTCIYQAFTKLKLQPSKK